MMMEPIFDPFETYFENDPNLIDINSFPMEDSSSLSPSCNISNNFEMNFDIDEFQKYLDDLVSSEQNLIDDQNEEKTREIGTDPMEPHQPISVNTKDLSIPEINSFRTNPIIIIKSNNPNLMKGNDGTTFVLTGPLQFENYPVEIKEVASNVELTTTIETNQNAFDFMTPSPSNDSLDEGRSSSPEFNVETQQNGLLTNLNALPKNGPLILTDEELKLIKQENHPIPTKLPLSKTEEKMLKRIQRKIKNKISAQESRRKKKEYVDALEKRIAEIVNENKNLKEKVSTMEKSQKSLTQERDLLKSMFNQGKTPQNTVLMVFALFFAVLIGIWSPLSNRTNVEDRSLTNGFSVVPSDSFKPIFSTQRKFEENEEKQNSNSIGDSFKSRVLLSFDDQDQQNQFGPNFPPMEKRKVLFAAPKTIEKFSNKRSRCDENQIAAKRRAQIFPKENFVIIEEEILPTFDNENKTTKIIRVEQRKTSTRNGTH